MDTPELVVEMMLRVDEMYAAPAPPAAPPQPTVPTIT